jgi:hypothetical protein
MFGPVRRIDDPNAFLDQLLAHATLLASLAVVGVALVTPLARNVLFGACVVSALATVRLFFHPFGLASLKRVYVSNKGEVLVAGLVGKAKPVALKKVEHDDHSPWPCALVLNDGSKVPFVARRDDGSNPLFDLEISDRARYDLPRSARDSIIDLQRISSPRIEDR